MKTPEWFRRWRDGPLLLTDQRPKETLRRFTVRVPVGFEMPEGTLVKDGYSMIVEAGIRWHPEWAEPQVTVNAWRVMALGDVLCVAGDDVEALYGRLLPPEVRALSLCHGWTMDKLGDFGREAVARLRVEAPSAKQSLSAFILPEQRIVH